MKKSILTLVALGAAASVMGQGYINFSTRVSGTVVGHVYGTGGAGTNGNTAAETPAGTTTYSGALLQGTGFSAQLFSGPAGVVDPNALVAVPGSITSFRTGATLGGTPAPLVLVVPNVAIHAAGTFQVRAWDVSTGADWASATTKGASALFQVANLGDGVLDFPADMAGFRSFNLVGVPEPSTFVLAGLGAAALVIFRRRK